MRKPYYLFFVLILICSGCSSESENKDENQQLIGTWRLVADSVNGVERELTPCDNEVTIQFLYDSRFISTGPFTADPPETPPCGHGQSNALFQMDGMEIAFFSETDIEFSRPNSTFTIVSLTDSTLILNLTFFRSTITDPEDTIVTNTWEKVN